ncbi:MAG: alpha/beta hydrolase [Gemmatimonadales bacterium]|nr:MAG: alpha/beta hydrolase [Gemmatimonadales bacterium]
MSADPERPAPVKLSFPSEGGSLEGDLYLPGVARTDGAEDRLPAGRPRPPVVVMAHGIGAERSYGLAPFADRFRDRGLAVLVFDYRHFGGSSGTPRRLVSPARQLADYRAALTCVRSDPRLDGKRIGLWGTSFSGGHVLRTAADAPAGVKAVVAQIPFVSGLASSLAFPLRYQFPAITLGLIDALRRAFGLSPLTVPIVREGGLALLASPDSHDGYLSLVPDDAPAPGPVPARTFLQVLRYHPGRRAERIRVPTLILGASDDRVTPIGATRRVARRLPNGRIEEFPIGHFDAYHGEWFEKVSSRAAEFFVEHLTS